MGMIILHFVYFTLFERPKYLVHKVATRNEKSSSITLANLKVLGQEGQQGNNAAKKLLYSSNHDRRQMCRVVVERPSAEIPLLNGVFRVSTGNALTAMANRIFGVIAPIVVIYANLETAAPVYDSGALFIAAGVLVTTLPFEPRGKANL